MASDTRHPLLADTSSLIAVANTDQWDVLAESLALTTTNVCKHGLQNHVNSNTYAPGGSREQYLKRGSQRVLEHVLVIVGFGLASWWAYDNSGLAVSVALVGAPVAARLTYYWWLYLDQPSPVALPLSFGGSGAWKLWIPLALLLGVIAFGLGVTLCWTHRFIAGKSPSPA